MFKFNYKHLDIAHKIDPVSSPTEVYEKHLHYFYEILFFVRGKANYTVDSDTRKLESGDIVLIAPGKIHFATVDSKYIYERYVLKFPDTLVPPFLKEKLSAYAPFFQHSKVLTYCFKELDSYINIYTEEELQVLIECTILKLLVQLCNESKNEKFTQNSMISDLIHYIDEHIEENITLETLNRDFHFSKSYISSEFKKHMKIPIMKYIRAKKIFAAHKMILEGEKKYIIASKLGFEDYSTFYRSYIKVMGFPPRQKD